ncbi:MAG: hypothetical protein AB7P17_00075 [Nitrospirales bacterium]|nr:hypothetical protein [Nitrospirales bacterium]
MSVVRLLSRTAWACWDERDSFRSTSAPVGLLILTVCFLGNPINAVQGEADETPLAGQPYTTEFLGKEVHIPSRDRRYVTAVNIGVSWVPDGPSRLEILPLGALYVWRNWEEENRRFRGTFSGAFNDVQYDHGLTSLSPWFAVVTFENLIIPFGRYQYVEGQRISQVDLEWNYVFAGIGIGYRTSLSPWHQDNAFDFSLTYEPGYRWFDRSSKTSDNFTVPYNTYEGRVHARLRIDKLERNLQELLHKGWALGGDALYGHRTHWRRWGDPEFAALNLGDNEKTFMLASLYAAVAGKLPWIPTERHRLIATMYGGIGKNLDRFSTFRLPGRPTGYEWESLSRPLIPGPAFNELFPRKYAIANLTYQYEALFFLYPYIRGTWSAIERPRFRNDGSIRNEVDMLPAVGGGVVSGAPWGSQIEINYSYNFGIFRDRDGPEMGGHSVLLFWSKLL